MAKSQRTTRVARKPRTLKVVAVDVGARPHRRGGLTLVFEGFDAENRNCEIELEMGSRSWWRYIAQALGQGAA